MSVEKTPAEIISLCLESFDTGAESYKNGLISGLKVALKENPDLTGEKILGWIEKLDIKELVK